MSYPSVFKKKKKLVVEPVHWVLDELYKVYPDEVKDWITKKVWTNDDTI